MAINNSRESSKRYQLNSLVKLVFVPLIVALSVWMGYSYLKDRSVRRDQKIQQDKVDRLSYGKAYMRIEVLGMLAEEYALEHGDRLPPAESWEDALRPYAVKAGENFDELVVSPVVPKQPPFARRFAMNKALSNCRIRVPQDISYEERQQVILFFSSVASSPNAADNITSLPPPEDGQIAVCFLAGPESYYNLMSDKLSYQPQMEKLAPAVERSHEIEKVVGVRQHLQPQ